MIQKISQFEPGPTQSIICSYTPDYFSTITMLVEYSAMKNLWLKIGF